MKQLISFCLLLLITINASAGNSLKSQILTSYKTRVSLYFTESELHQKIKTLQELHSPIPKGLRESYFKMAMNLKNHKKDSVNIMKSIIYTCLNNYKDKALQMLCKNQSLVDKIDSYYEVHAGQNALLDQYMDDFFDIQAVLTEFTPKTESTDSQINNNKRKNGKLKPSTKENINQNSNHTIMDK
ncbi:hypothetical protein A9Q84_16405 [Halobacteriovorax marinus]|uniref:Uncharacterized protein n=1 Tax=Halobacteriovorax marinus TaxID=97084 RepID=A0A1Y5F4T9_9BACT|nr:hypothetical protein A9Q84_16405 [Halobacteriovorax marinus]